MQTLYNSNYIRTFGLLPLDLLYHALVSPEQVRLGGGAEGADAAESHGLVLPVAGGAERDRGQGIQFQAAALHQLRLLTEPVPAVQHLLVYDAADLSHRQGDPADAGDAVFRGDVRHGLYNVFYDSKFVHLRSG